MTIRLDRSSWPSARARPARVVHLGAGNFSRAHQAWYTLNADPEGEWGIAAFSGRGGEVAAALAQQDGLYTLIERGPTDDRLTVVDTLVAAHDGTDPAALTAAIAAPATALVTLTITEAGYVAGRENRPTGVFGDPPSRPTAPTAAAGRESRPTGAFVDPPQPDAPVLERLAHALAARRDAGAGPLALVSCDNLHANGEVLRGRIFAHADALEPALATWIERNVAFVSTSVDRITPRTTDADRRLVTEELGLLDAVPVVCEPFSDWVLCGDFPAGRPRWEDTGARFVKDVEPWELRKLWLLNGGHSLLAYMGLPRGHATVAEAVADPQLRGALNGFWDLAQRRLPESDELDLPHYRRQLLERFENARIGYPLTQIGTDGLAKLRNRVVPVIDAALGAGEPLAALEPALHVVSAWIHWLSAQDLSLDLRPRLDADIDQIRAAMAEAGNGDPTPALIALLAPAWSEHPDLLATLTRPRDELPTRTEEHRP